MLTKIVALLLLAYLASAKVFPPPAFAEYPQGYLSLKSVCHLFISSQHPQTLSNYYFHKVQTRLNRKGPCLPLLTFNRDIHVKLTASINKALPAEGYELIVNQEGIQIWHNDYSGYVYALETLSQLIGDGAIPYTIIRDQPLVSYRGIMIDSARHFLSVNSIKRVIQAMPLSKLNILHWHIVDDESFPLVLDSHPELAQGSKYSNAEVYTKQQVQDLIAYAQQNAVQIVPQIDTPAHVRSWGQSSQWSQKNISIKCAGGTGYNGQFDVSIPEVFTLAKDVIKEVNDLFKASPYIHLGGDQVSSRCWDLRPAIKDFMTKNNISSYGQLQMYWRKQIKSVLPAGRVSMFWRNDAVNVSTIGTDILHYWGAQKDTARVTNGTTSPIVLSPSDLLYISKGMGNLWLNGSQGQYAVWRNIYENFTVFPEGVDKSRILGAQVCLWGEVSNEDTLENNLWMRSSAFASRVWNEKILNTWQIVAYLVQLQYTLYDMDIDASPVTSEFCEHKPKTCFPPQARPQEMPNIVEM